MCVLDIVVNLENCKHAAVLDLMCCGNFLRVQVELILYLIQSQV